MADAIYQPGPLIPVLDPNDDIVRVDQLTGTTFRFTFPNGKQWTFTLPPGAPGFPGTNGVTPTFTVGKVTSLPPGGVATVVVRSTDQPNRYALDFQLPTGPVGPSPALVAGTTSSGTLASSVTPTGNPNEYAINLTLPQTPGTGNVNGPASAIDSAIVLYDGTTGKLIKDSGKRISDLGGTETVVPVTAARTLSASDAYKLLLCSGGPYAITGSPSTFGAGLWVDIKNTLPGVLTFTPSSGTVDGLASIKIYGESFRLLSDGTNFYTANRQRRVLAGLTTIASAVASVAYTALGETEVGDFELEFNGLTTSANVSVVMTVSQGGTFLNSGYTTAGNQATNSGGSANVTTGGNSFNLQPNGQITAGNPSSGLFRLGGFRLGAPGLSLFGLSNTPVTTGSSYGYTVYGWSTVASTTPIDGISIAPNSGNFTAGTVKLWALRG